MKTLWRLKELWLDLVAPIPLALIVLPILQMSISIRCKVGISLLADVLVSIGEWWLCKKLFSRDVQIYNAEQSLLRSRQVVAEGVYDFPEDVIIRLGKKGEEYFEPLARAHIGNIYTTAGLHMLAILNAEFFLWMFFFYPSRAFSLTMFLMFFIFAAIYGNEYARRKKFGRISSFLIGLALPSLECGSLALGFALGIQANIF